MKCIKCGHKLRIGDEFCGKCGTAVEPDIVYEEKDLRKERNHNDDTKTFRAGEDHYKENKYNDHAKEKEHDITGEVNLEDEDSATKKASKWTSKGIAAATGIAAAFVVAIIALNVQNTTKKNDTVDMGEAARTTTSTTRAETETTTGETSGSGNLFKNPLENLLNPGNNDNSDDPSKDSGYGFKNPFEGLINPNPGSDDNAGNKYGEAARDFFEGIEGRLRDTADNFRERILQN